jgi:RNA recognition motif. (a.k.a. RRM, RBD, or RNP domain)
MKSHHSRPSGRRSGRGHRRSNRNRNENRPATPPPKKTLWQKIVAFFTGAPKPLPKAGASSNASAKSGRQKNESSPNKASSSRKVELVEVTTPKLYVGNLSFDATENDLSELFNGVGLVRNAEIVTHKDTEKSKGFGFVLMTTIDEAQRAVTELHDQAFLGRKLVVSGAKASERETNYRG